MASQHVSNGVHWEVIFIDNASTDGTLAVANQSWESMAIQVPFTAVTEQKSGKENAINRGLSLAKYQYVIFCDDDNWLKEDYVQLAYTIMSSNDQIGLLGGFGIPVFEDSRPEWFSTYEANYAVGKQNDANGEIPPGIDMRYVWGAGSVLNKNVYQLLTNVGFTRIITRERYPEFARCEDLELSYAIQLTGFKLWYDNRLEYKHFIAKKKLTWPYLVDMVKQGARARPYLMLYGALSTLPPIQGQHPYAAYHKLWRGHRRQYTLTMLRSAFTISKLKYNLAILLNLKIKGDAGYVTALTRWYFFFSWITFSEKKFKRILTLLLNLKNNLSTSYDKKQMVQ